MAQRLYLSGTAAAFNVGGSVNASGVAGMWEGKIALANTTYKLTTTATGTLAIASNVNVIGSGTNPNDWWYYSGMTDTLPNGKLLNGTVSGVALIRESSTNMNLYTQCGIYVVDSGGSVLATLIAPQTTGGVEANNPSANNRMYPRGNSGSGVSLSSYTTVNSTSRIVIEVGLRLETTRTGDSGYCYIGNDGGSDLPLGDGTDNSTTKNPWFEFSVDIFTPPAGGSSRVQAAGFYGFHDHQDRELGGWKRGRSGLWTPRWED